MAIPTYDKLLRPVLELASRQSITRRTASEAMTELHRLTPEERGQLLPSGGDTFINNRTGWAMTFLTKAGLIARTKPRTYEATTLGRDFLRKHPTVIREYDLRAIPGYHEAWEAGSARRQEREKQQQGSTTLEFADTETPHEIIAREAARLRTDLRGRLLQAIVDQTPAFFETLVLDVLISMGYGGSREDAAEHLGRSGDEGIDGRINQDALGLDQVMVQAKRYRPDRTVDRHEVQAFIGSLSGHGVTKGVFISTSKIAASAREFVARGSTTKVILVDGEMLIDLMLRHKIGVRTVKTHEIQELDQNYFDEGE